MIEMMKKTTIFLLMMVALVACGGGDDDADTGTKPDYIAASEELTLSDTKENIRIFLRNMLQPQKTSTF